MSPPGELELVLELVTAPAATPYGTTNILATLIVHKSALDACATCAELLAHGLPLPGHAANAVIPDARAHSLLLRSFTYHAEYCAGIDGHGTVTATAIEAAECTAGTAERSEGVTPR